MMLEQEPASREALLAEAQAVLATGAFEQAIELFAACLAQAPQDASAYQGRAIAHFQLHQWALAVADFTRARDLNPADPENGVGVGMSLAMENQVYEAVDALEALLTEHPQYVRGHIQLGLLYFKLCAIAKGRRQLERALACRPTLAERRFIEQSLKEQQQLDQKRYYRPDFEALNQRQDIPGLWQWFRRWRARGQQRSAERALRRNAKKGHS